MMNRLFNETNNNNDIEEDKEYDFSDSDSDAENLFMQELSHAEKLVWEQEERKWQANFKATEEISTLYEKLYLTGHRGNFEACIKVLEDVRSSEYYQTIKAKLQNHEDVLPAEIIYFAFTTDNILQLTSQQLTSKAVRYSVWTKEAFADNLEVLIAALEYHEAQSPEDKLIANDHLRNAFVVRRDRNFERRFLNLAGANLAHADLCKLYLDGTDLTRANLSDTHLNGSRFGESNLSHANLEKAHTIAGEEEPWGTAFTGLLRGANLENTHFIKGAVNGADLTGASLKNAKWEYITFSDSIMTGVNLENAVLEDSGMGMGNGPDLTGACIINTDLSRFNILLSNFKDAKILDESAFIDSASLIKALKTLNDRLDDAKEKKGTRRKDILMKVALEQIINHPQLNKEQLLPILKFIFMNTDFFSSYACQKILCEYEYENKFIERVLEAKIKLSELYSNLKINKAMPDILAFQAKERESDYYKKIALKLKNKEFICEEEIFYFANVTDNILSLNTSLLKECRALDFGPRKAFKINLKIMLNALAYYEAKTPDEKSRINKKFRKACKKRRKLHQDMMGPQEHCAYWYVNIPGADLKDINLSKTDTNYFNLENANLKAAILNGTSFIGSNLTSADLENAATSVDRRRGTETDFCHASLRNANLKGTYFFNGSFRHADLSYANLENSEIAPSLFDGAKIRHANLNGASIANIHTNVGTYDLSHSSLINTDLSDFYLEYATLDHVKIVAEDSFDNARTLKASLKEIAKNIANWKPENVEVFLLSLAKQIIEEINKPTYSPHKKVELLEATLSVGIFLPQNKAKRVLNYLDKNLQQNCCGLFKRSNTYLATNPQKLLETELNKFSPQIVHYRFQRYERL